MPDNRPRTSLTAWSRKELRRLAEKEVNDPTTPWDTVSQFVNDLVREHFDLEPEFADPNDGVTQTDVTVDFGLAD